MSDGTDGASFNQNYRVLKETADWLSGQQEPDIDQLVPKVETAMKAYAICKERLDKVQATLGQYFPNDAPAAEAAAITNGHSNGNGKARKSSRPAPGSDGADGKEFSF